MGLRLTHEQAIKMGIIKEDPEDAEYFDSFLLTEIEKINPVRARQIEQEDPDEIELRATCKRCKNNFRIMEDREGNLTIYTLTNNLRTSELKCPFCESLKWELF